jgi:hypothetical protein
VTSLFDKRVAALVRLGVPRDEAKAATLKAMRAGIRAAREPLSLREMVCRASDALATWDERRAVAP